jgi:hypothetical protein
LRLLRRRLAIDQRGRLFWLTLLFALAAALPGSVSAAELFGEPNTSLELPGGQGGGTGDPEAVVAELPAPREVPTDIAAELERLQKQIDELQAARDAASGAENPSPKATVKEKASGTVAEKTDTAGEKAETPLVDRLSSVEKVLGKLVDTNDKKKKDDAE